MDELTFRNKLRTHPNYLDDEMVAFLEANPEQKAVVQSFREFDHAISETLDVEVPEGLHARILLKQSYLEEQEISDESASNVTDISAGKSQVIKSTAESSWNLNWLYGIAASVLVFAVGINLWSNSSPVILTGDDFVNHVIHHLEDDPDYMVASNSPKSQAEMSKLFTKVGATLDKPIDGMTYAGVCDVEGQEGLHIEMQDQGRHVTVIVIPGQQAEAALAFNKSGYKGEIIPVKGGVVAIVADTMQQLALAQIRFFKSVRFV